MTLVYVDGIIYKNISDYSGLGETLLLIAYVTCDIALKRKQTGCIPNTESEHN
ncbi:Uncharacterized protein dnm_020450 [Desulfonema magnum]|uniref:Uncharacterized protein n=1 Tax=Desulfonema magnum TaxID=45655 RepID=A0A975BII6_9BACT|nr:Uncharacterized protein dnm_020450 [Desulfonema magnum]